MLMFVLVCHVVCLWTAQRAAPGHPTWCKSYGVTRAPVAHTVQSDAACGPAVWVTAAHRLNAVGLGANEALLALTALSERSELVSCTEADLADDWCKTNLDYMSVNLLSGLVRVS